jgi:O-antigen/teichoic acid export membrane protein
MLVSGILVFIVPNNVNIETYGYWQLYVLYSGYLTYLSLGIPDGIYLKKAGKELQDVDKSFISTHFWVLVIMSFLLNGISYSILSSLFDGVSNKIVIFSVLSSLLTIPRSFLAYLYQATGKIKDFIIGHVIERIIYLILTLSSLFIGQKSIEGLIIPDILGKIFSLIYFIILSSASLNINMINLKKYYRAFFDTMSIGIKILISNFSSLLIVGIIRFAIENNWGIEYFGKISLTLSLTNMILSFFAAISIVMVPILKKSNPESLFEKYNSLNIFLTFFIIGMLSLYFVFENVLLSLFPVYGDSVYYLGILFPICLFESKMSLLNVTYFKTLRKEKEMVRVNLITLLLSIVCTYLFTKIYVSFDMLVYTIIVLLGFRCILAEKIIFNSYKEKARGIISLEVIFTIMFILFNIFTSSIVAFFLYLLSFIVVTTINREKLIDIIVYIKGKIFA